MPPDENTTANTAGTASTAPDTIQILSQAQDLPLRKPFELSKEESIEAVESLRALLRFETVSVTAPTTGEYKRCAEFLKSRLEGLQCLDYVQFLEESPSNCPVVVARWPGQDENADNLPVILLNSHYDVVPADPKDWTVPPFNGFMEDGKIFGRGAQDMKCVCIQYIESIRILHNRFNFAPRRHVYLTFVPDEEVGGAGMACFLDSKLYKSLPGIALALDEGLASETDIYSVFYGERLPWWVSVTSKGNTGHGSRFIESTAVEQIVELCNKALAFRKEQRAMLHGGACDHVNCSHAIAARNRKMAKKMKDEGHALKLGDVTSLNVTTLQAGVRIGDTYTYNVVPPEASCSLDIRISPHVDPADVKEMINTWCQESATSGGSMSWDFVHGQGNDDSIGHSLTSFDPVLNPWYKCFADAMTRMDLKIVPEVFPAATDSRFLRALGIRALGFSPMRNSEILLHENDEYILKEVFVEGVGVMVGVISALGSQGPEDVSIVKD